LGVRKKPNVVDYGEKPWRVHLPGCEPRGTVEIGQRTCAPPSCHASPSAAIPVCPMKCPVCQSRELAVEITFHGMIACRFRAADEFELLQPPHFESHWDNSSRAACLKCSWQGTVSDASRRSRSSRRPSDSPRSKQPRRRVRASE
jgi:hypothetical protein